MSYSLSFHKAEKPRGRGEFRQIPPIKWECRKFSFSTAELSYFPQCSSTYWKGKTGHGQPLLQMQNFEQPVHSNSLFPGLSPPHCLQGADILVIFGFCAHSTQIPFPACQALSSLAVILDHCPLPTPSRPQNPFTCPLTCHAHTCSSFWNVPALVFLRGALFHVKVSI